MTHPLTDGMIEEIKSDVFSQAPKLLTPGIAPSVWSSDCMRAAYDKGGEDMLGRVIEWLKTNPMDTYLHIDFSGCWMVDEDEFVEDLKEAIRPQVDS